MAYSEKPQLYKKEPIMNENNTLIVTVVGTAIITAVLTKAITKARFEQQKTVLLRRIDDILNLSQSAIGDILVTEATEFLKSTES